MTNIRPWAALLAVVPLFAACTVTNSDGGAPTESGGEKQDAGAKPPTSSSDGGATSGEAGPAPDASAEDSGPEGPLPACTLASAGSCTCTASVCKSTCPQGSCDYVAEGGTNAEFTCSGGDCTVRCEAGATCDNTCSGSGCTFECAAGSTCTNTCSGGGCTFKCAPGACDNSCSGGGCMEL